jgi:predicted phosphodiesterase
MFFTLKQYRLKRIAGIKKHFEKILLLSDTHSHIDDTILKYVAQADEVWHAGDIGNLAVTDAIKLKPLRCVYVKIDDATANGISVAQSFYV